MRRMTKSQDLAVTDPTRLKKARSDDARLIGEPFVRGPGTCVCPFGKIRAQCVCFEPARIHVYSRE